MTETAVFMDQVTLQYQDFGQGDTALNCVSLKVGFGEMIEIVGSNGSGKSSLLKVIYDKDIAYSGLVTIKGRDKRTVSRRQLSSWVYYVNQDTSMGTYADLTVLENLIAMDSRKPSKGQKTAYLDVLKIGRLDQFSNKIVRYLSGGQKQILSLLIATVRSPDIILLDEPYSALDERNQILANQIISKWKKNQKTIFTVSHFASNGGLSPDRTLQISEGQIKYE